MAEQHDTSELIAYGRRAVELAIKRGAEEAEAYLSMSGGISIEIERGQIVRSIKRNDQGLGIRVIYRKAVGFSYTNTLTDKNIEDSAARAFRAARASKPDKNWVNLPSPRCYTETRGTYDKRIFDLSSNDLVKLASDMLIAARDYDQRILAVDGGVATSMFSSVVINSHDIEVSDVGTAVGCSMETIARDGADLTPACHEFNAERVYDIDPVAVGVEAARQAVSSLGAKKVKSDFCPVIFTQVAFGSLLYHTALNAIKADYVQRERSPFKDKIGEQVASDEVTVTDNGLLEGGLLTSKFDGEGVPCQKTQVLNKGVLKNYLYDNYTAKKAGIVSTGNASRSGIAPYGSTPILDASNFVFKEGNKTPEELVSEVKDGLIVYGVQGAHSSNPESGEFSVVATPVWKVENGCVVYPVRNIMLTGVFFDVLKNISALSNNTRKLGQLVAPWIRVENVRSIGRL